MNNFHFFWVDECVNFSSLGFQLCFTILGGWVGPKNFILHLCLNAYNVEIFFLVKVLISSPLKGFGVIPISSLVGVFSE